ncbi:MAG: SIS domain-containing protein [Nitrososphaerales archaeon]
MRDPFSLSRIQSIDLSNVHKTYETWPGMARSGFEAEFNLQRAGFRKACILGMGGSAAGGDIIASWLSDRPKFEVATFKGQLPNRNMSDSLAIACSASGQTKETIEMMEIAVRRGATTVSISAGGKLLEVSKRLGVPHIMMPKVVAPRYMLPFIIFSCLSVINEGLGLDCEDEAENAFKEMEVEGRAVRINVPASRNPSKQLALSILEKTPAIYGSRSTRGAGIRFKNVLNENAKRHAIFDELPDTFHNEIEAWDNTEMEFVPVFLRHPAETERDKAGADAMVEILSELKVNPVEVRGRGRSSLAQLVTMVYRLDMSSYYIAIGTGRDPFPTRLIDRLKGRA